MPVIGRLDGQVDDVLIKPVSRRRDKQDARDGEKFPKEQTEPPAEEAKEDAPARERPNLPVWLL
jgi:hypothetical protein